MTGGHIRSVVEDSLTELVDLLPSLRTGEGIIMGEMVRLPMRTRFNKAKDSKSTDPLVSVQWKKESPHIDNYKLAVDYWRNNKFSR